MSCRAFLVSELCQFQDGGASGVNLFGIGMGYAGACSQAAICSNEK